jgi:hypothetical protein
MDTWPIEVSFSDENQTAIANVLNEAGVANLKVSKPVGFAGLELLMLGAIAAPMIGNLIIKLSRLWQCGTVVDARNSKIVTEKNCDLPRGTVLIIAPDGVQSKLHEPSEIEVKSLLEIALKAKP